MSIIWLLLIPLQGRLYRNDNQLMGGQLESARSRGDNRVRFDGPIEPEGRHLEATFLDEIFSHMWHIDFKSYTESHWQSVLKHVTSCTTRELSLKNINAPDILTRIVHIKFESLLQLKLNNLYVVTVEPLIHLKAPRLEVLQFSLNGFHSLKSLRKMDAPNLKKLQLYQNSLVEADRLTECRFHNEMNSIIMFNAKTKTLPECYSWLFKMQAHSIAYFEYYNTQIIRNQPYKQMARQKYPRGELKLRFDTI